MTGTAGFPLLHLRHGVTLALSAGCEDTVVALIAFINPEMKQVAEFNLTGVGKIKDYLIDTVVTSVTTAGNTESNICIMAGAAGTVLLHLAHRVSATPLAAGKYPAVTVNTDIHFFDSIGMNLMTEECRNLLETDIRRPFVAFLAVTFY